MSQVGHGGAVVNAPTLQLLGPGFKAPLKPYVRFSCTHTFQPPF